MKMKTNHCIALAVILMFCAVQGCVGEMHESAPVNSITPKGIVNDWLVLGTFPNQKIDNAKPKEVSRTGFDQDFLQSLGGEAAAAIRSDAVVLSKDTAGTEYRAKAHTLSADDDGIVNLPEALGVMDGKCAYAFCYIKSDKERSVICRFGCDDSAKIWINGQLVNKLWAQSRWVNPWADKFTATLHAGFNSVLVKVENRRMSLRVFDEADYPTALLSIVEKYLTVRPAKKELGADQRDVTVTVDYVPTSFLPPDKALVSPISVACSDADGRWITRQDEITGKPFTINLPETATGIIKITAREGMTYVGQQVGWQLPAEESRRVGVTYVLKGDLNKVVAELAGKTQAFAKRYNITDSPADSANAPAYIKHNRALVMQAIRFLSVPDLPKADRVFGQMLRIETLLRELEQGHDPIYSSAVHTCFSTYNDPKAAPGGKMVPGYEYYVCLPKDFPAKDKKWPLILYLHGGGTRGDNIEQIKTEGLLKELATLNASRKDDVFPGVVIAPQCPAGVGWWTNEMVKAMLDDVTDTLPIDKDRIYITGMSLGGIGTWSMITAYPDYFAAAVPICGRGDPAKADRIKDLPIWTFHGEKDGMLPIVRTKDMVAALKAVGSKVKFTIYPEAGHDAWTQTYSNSKIYEWLLQQKRNPK